MYTIQSKYIELTNKLRKFKNLKLTYSFLISLFRALSATIIITIILTTFELLFEGDKAFRASLFFLLLLCFVGSFSFWLYPTIRAMFSPKSKISLDELAFEIGLYYPDVKDRLSNSIQLMSQSGHLRGTSEHFVHKAFESAYESSANKDFSVVLDKRNLRRSGLLFLLSLIILLLLLISFSQFGFAFYRIVNFNKSFIPPAPFSLKIHPKYATAKRGENIRIEVKGYGTLPQTIELKIKEFQQQDYETIPLTLDSGNIYKFELLSVKNSIKFFAEANWITEKVLSDIGEIVVIEHPLVESIAGKIIPPAYTNTPPTSFTEQNADINALIGSQILLNVTTNKKVQNAHIILIQESFTDSSITHQLDTVIYKMNVEGNKASGNFSARFSGTYYIMLQDYDGLNNENPLKYKIVVSKDNYPDIKLLEPQTDVTVSENAILPMMVFISDDYGFSSLKLHYRLIASEYSTPWEKFSTIPIPFSNNQTEMQVPFIWDLNKLNISPSDEYEFFVEVADNDRVTGPKTARTQSIRLKLPSLDDVFKEANKSQQSISKELDKTLKQANEIKQEMEEIQRELQQKPNKNQLDWGEKKKIENLVNKQKELTNKLSEIQNNLEELTRRMTENNLLSPETLQKYMELQKLLQEVNSPELRKLQQQLEQALQKLSPEDIKNALQNFKFDEKQFRQNLERTIKILKRLQAEQKTDALLKRAEELLRKQEELQQQTKNSNPSDQNLRKELAQRQNQLQKELNAINKEIEDLKKLMEEIGKDMPKNELDEAQSELSPEETNQDMQDAENSLQSGNFNKASQSQQKAKNRLNKFSQKMKKLKEELEKRTSKEAIKKLQKALNDVLTLSKEQGQIRKQTQQSDANSTKIPELARQESNLTDALINIANSLFELSQKTFSVTPEMARSLGEALESMQQATDDLANRRINNAMNSQGNAIQSLNKTAMQIQSMLASMQGQGACDNPGGMGQNGKGGAFNFMQRLQQIASAQQSINQMAQQLANNQGNLSPEQQAQLARIVAEQGRAQKALEDLSNEQKKLPQQDKRILGSLEKILQEMQEVISEMKSGQITPETLKRQERILSRLLDATKSIYERDFEERRESTPGKELSKTSPPEISPQILNKKTFEQIINELKQTYTKDYEELIRKYFFILQNSNLFPIQY